VSAFERSLSIASEDEETDEEAIESEFEGGDEDLDPDLVSGAEERSDKELAKFEAELKGFKADEVDQLAALSRGDHSIAERIAVLERLDRLLDKQRGKQKTVKGVRLMKNGSFTKQTQLSVPYETLHNRIQGRIEE
jgi:hypothetical protein